MALLTITQQQLIKPISPNWAATPKVSGGVLNFEQLAEEVEQKELRKLLGSALLLDIQTNPTESKYIDLLDGKTFENCNGDNVQFKGIRYQLAYMNYSKYIRISKIADTFTGFVKKNRNESEDLGQGDLKNEMNDARELALSDYDVMKIYLDDNPTIYTLWDCGIKKKIYTPRLMTVRKTLK